MGIFRLILAMAVLLSHLPDLGNTTISRETIGIKVWSGHAVFAFFIISGFYISLVINEKYVGTERGVAKFYLNRALRLYPAHWAVLALYALVFAAAGLPSFLLGDTYGQPGLATTAWLSNLSFFGVEYIAFFNLDNWKFVIGPVWSLGVEVCFYILAPFVVTRRLPILAAITLGFFAFRIGLYQAGVPLLPWRYFFFPADFVFFLMGSLAYRLYAIRERIPAWRTFSYAAAAMLAFSVVFDPLWTASGQDQWLSWVFFLLVWVCVPFVFALTKDSGLDNFIGQLTYPLYIGHLLVITAIGALYAGDMDKGLLAVAGSLGLALALYFLVDRPIERIRQKVTRSARAKTPCEPGVEGLRSAA